MDLERELAVAVAAAEAARAAAQGLQGRVGSVAKADGSPVSEADHTADRLIVELLAEAFPADGILSEERPDGPERLALRRLWIIDPIDGTQGFIEGSDEWAVQVALAIDGVATLGVLALPRATTTYAGVLGGGAVVRDQTGERPLRATAGAEVLLTSRRRQDPRLAAFPAWPRRPMHGVGAKVAELLAGRASAWAHPQPIHEWDLAAPAAVLAAAGGRASDPYGADLVFNQAEPRCPGALMSVGDHHQRLLDALATS